MRWPAFVRLRRCLVRLRAAVETRPYTILMFHRVAKPAVGDFLPSALSCAPAVFESVLRFLRAEANVLPLQSLADTLRRRDVPGRAVALTFDDGFRDNFTNAFPLLRRYDVPATVFVTADAVDSTELLPVHRCYYARLLGGAFDDPVDSPERRAKVDAFLKTSDEAVPPLGSVLYLHRDELRAMADAGIEIGAHTCSHPWLASLSADDQRREIVRSKEILEQITGKPVTTFAYPYGYPESFDTTSAAVVAEHFQIACLSGDTGRTDDLLALPRANIAHFGGG